MKRSLLNFATIFTLAIIRCLYTVAEAFHAGGVGYCDGCHTMHADQAEDSLPNSSLLKGSDPSSTCLGCHAEMNHEYSIFNQTSPAHTAGGDFSWIQPAPGHGSYGDNNGHNVIATDFGLGQDNTHQYAPGSNYPARDLHCISCHDPHGKNSDGQNSVPIAISGSYGNSSPADDSQPGNFRLLGGLGYSASRKAEAFIFNAPIAVAPPAAKGAESNSNHTAYGQGMSEWCANCHRELLNPLPRDNSTMHPAGNQAKLNARMVIRYNSYVKTGEFSGTTESAYLNLVPFELGTDNLSRLDPHSTVGPNSDANVMCLTCHRAHASPYANSGRWDFEATFLAQDSARIKSSEATAAFANFQRQLCEKCHTYR